MFIFWVGVFFGRLVCFVGFWKTTPLRCLAFLLFVFDGLFGSVGLHLEGFNMFYRCFCSFLPGCRECKRKECNTSTPHRL